MRNANNIYPDFTAEINELKKQAITPELLYKIINKHRPNMLYNKQLYSRYKALEASVPIFDRKPRFEDDATAINNKINNDFFSKIVDFKTGYFAGVPIAYGYSKTDESESVTGGEAGVDDATKALTDFITRSNMFDVDMETTKDASICGYAARLFYTDNDAHERVMPIKPYEAIILSSKNIMEPEYAVRYYSTKDINGATYWNVEFYDDAYIYYFSGTALSDLTLERTELNMFDYCPLQGIQNNNEMLGDAEKVLALIDAYDRTLSDCSNEIESFSNAYMVFENLNVDEDTMNKAQKTGSFKFFSGAAEGKVYFLTKDINDTFNENFLNRIEDNIYNFSNTPNLDDDSFGNASGTALKFKLTGLETKCGMYQGKVMTAGTYMFKLLSSSWIKKKITVDPLQCTMDFKRNFPLDSLSNAQAAQAYIAAGLPKQIAWTLAIPELDDVDYALEILEEEQNDIPSLFNADDSTQQSEDEPTNNDNNLNAADTQN